MNDLISIGSFEDIKHIDEFGNEFWYARELQVVLDYKEWRKFENVINKAIVACSNSKIGINEHFGDVDKMIEISVSDHFVGVDKMVEIGSGAMKNILDYKLSRYACYLIAQNADSRKKDCCSCSNIFCYSN